MYSTRSPPSKPDSQQQAEANNSLTKEKHTMSKMFEVKLKVGHPTNSYSRDGITFTGRFITTYAADPVRLTEDQVTEGMRNDQWLEITEIQESD
jgi:hypothetical protein